MPFLYRLASGSLMTLARVLTGVRPDWRGTRPELTQRIYFANHSSHGDLVLIWSVLPEPLRERTRPVAGADYWRKGRLRRFFGERVFRAVLIDRVGTGDADDPLAVMRAALDEGSSLILFPEGTRNMSDAPLLPFRSGLYNLALARPDVELIPTFIDNISRVLPKGEVLPLPILCSVTFGAPLHLSPGEERKAFLERARTALIALRPGAGRAADPLVEKIDAT
jgi:1-acyl-sn-glycerol-3-phosphate acyltransferase